MRISNGSPPLSASLLHAFFAVFNGRLTDLADFYFSAVLFLFIEQFHVASLADGAFTAAFVKQFPNSFAPMRF
jgi:hypothetical protein